MQKTEVHEWFWQGEGPCLVLIPPSQLPLYDLKDYPTRFRDPHAMLESEIRRAQAVLDWPTDGIPTVRPNLGTVFIPSMMGLDYEIRADQMPWPGPPLSRDAIRARRDVDPAEAELMKYALAFYRAHRALRSAGRRTRGRELVEGSKDDGAAGPIAAYLPDTQGVFDIAHLLYGDTLLYDLADAREAAWVEELMESCLVVYIRVSRLLKEVLGEEMHSMIHGHATPQGVYFPHAGVRISEDTATLLSPQMIERLVMPYIERSMEPFGGGFVHLCGHHPSLFERLCHCESVRAIDLGNPEMYGPRWLLDRCAETGTVLYSRLAAEDEETWEDYVRRIARIITDAGARCILRPTVFPGTRQQCEDMLGLWHTLTA